MLKPVFNSVNLIFTPRNLDFKPQRAYCTGKYRLYNLTLFFNNNNYAYRLIYKDTGIIYNITSNLPDAK